MKTIFKLSLLALLLCHFSYTNAQLWQKSSVPNTTGGDYDFFDIVSNGSRLIAASSNGIYVSDDNGDHWQHRYSGMNSHYITALLIDGSNILAGSYNGQIYLSSDNGDTWQLKVTLTDAFPVMDLAKIGNVLFAVNQFKAYASYDQGSTWQEKSNGLPGAYGLLVKGNLIFANGGTGSVWVSSDLGEYWQSVSTGLNGAINSLTTDGSTIWAATSGYGVYKTVNDGLTWTSSWSGMPGTSCQFVKYLSNGRLVTTDYSSLYVSDNGGNSWAKLGNKFKGYSATQMVEHQSSLYATTWSSGIFKSVDNANNWVQTNTGIPSSINKLFNLFGKIYAGGNQKIVVSDDEGQTFNVVSNLPANTALLSSYTNGNRTYIGTSRGLFYSDDQGQNWTSLVDFSNQTINGITGNGTNIYLTTYMGVYSSYDNGLSWQYSDGNGDFYVGVNAIGYIAGKLFVNVDNSTYESDDNGISWYRVDYKFSSSPIGYYPNNGKLFAYGSSLKVSDDGITFTSVNMPLQYMNINDFKIHNGIYYVVGDKNDVFYSSNQGQTWNTYSDGLFTQFNFVVRSIEFTNDKAVVSTGGPSFVFYNNELPSVPVCPPINLVITPSHAEVCIGTAVTITASGANNYVWSTGETTSSISYVANTTSSVTVTGYISNSCSTSVSTNIMATPVPTVPIVSTDKNEYCGNENTTFTASGAGSGDSYNWYKADALNAIIGSATTQASVNSYTTFINVQSGEYLKVSIVRAGCEGNFATKTITKSTSNSLYFDGVDDKATVQAVNVESGSFSIGAQIKMDVQQNAISPVFFSKRSSLTSGYAFGTNNNGTTLWMWINGEIYNSTSIASSLFDGLCHSVFAIVQTNKQNSRSVEFYLDGNLISKSVKNGTINLNTSSSYALIGNDYSNSPYKGFIDLVAIWDAALNANQPLRFQLTGVTNRKDYIQYWEFSTANGTGSDAYMNGNGVLGSTSGVESSDPLLTCDIHCYTPTTKMKSDNLSEESTSSQDIQALPNPFGIATNVRLSGFHSDYVDLTLTDMSGIEIWHKQNHSVTEPIEVGEELNNGMYLLRVMGIEEVKAIKIIKAE